MLLTEHEAKRLLSQGGLQIPQGQLVSKPEHFPQVSQVGSVVKAQVLHGNRAQSGLVQLTNSVSETRQVTAKLLQAHDKYGDPIGQVLIEEKVEFSSEHYLSLRYDTRQRRLVCAYSSSGGIGMDDRADTLQTVQLSVLEQPTTFSIAPELLSTVQKLWNVLIRNDAVLIEINPLVETQAGFVCLDAKIELEDSARFRHADWEHIQRAAGEKKRTSLERQALAISREDHRGVAGESFFEFPGGTIGVLASGGGASALVMDGLIRAGFSPANYTEYSGNPAAAKVQKLTELVAGIDGLEALLVVGSTANFTDIYETLLGVVHGLLNSRLTNQFPVIIRRGGPRWQEAFEMVQAQLPADRFLVKLLGPDVPILDAVKVLSETLQQKVITEEKVS